MAGVTVSRINNLPKLSVDDEMDISNILDITSPLDKLASSGELSRGLIIDFCGCSYIDSAVLEVVVRMRNEVASSGNTLQVLTRRDSQPDRVLRTCRFDTILDLTSLDSPTAGASK